MRKQSPIDKKSKIFNFYCINYRKGNRIDFEIEPYLKKIKVDSIGMEYDEIEDYFVNKGVIHRDANGIKFNDISKEIYESKLPYYNWRMLKDIESENAPPLQTKLEIHGKPKGFMNQEDSSFKANITQHNTATKKPTIWGKLKVMLIKYWWTVAIPVTIAFIIKIMERIIERYPKFPCIDC